MKTLFFMLSILFGLLTLAGGSYVLSTGGQASPGLAAIPMLFVIAFLQAYRSAAGNDKR